jgi:hypothetical protein
MHGDAFAADLLAFAFIAQATFCLCYSRELRGFVRSARS